jgi:hypothetical protein
MNDFIERRDENQFANGQSRRDLRASSDAAELETQLMEEIDNVADFHRFVEISAREIAVNQRRLFENASHYSGTNGRGNQSRQRSIELPGRGDAEAC